MADKEVLVQLNRWEQFNYIVDNLDLDLKEKGLLIILFRFVNYRTGYADPSRALIKKLTKITDNRTLDKLIKSLIDKGILNRESIKGKRSRYFIKVGGKITPSAKNEPSGEITPVVGGEITPVVGGEITPQKEKKIKLKENNIYTLSEDLDSEEYMKKIDSIWERIIYNYNSDLIEKEKAKLTAKKLSGLILLEELERNLESNKKEIKREYSKDIENIFECWNSKGIIKHKTLSQLIKKSIEKSLRVYKVDEIVQAINIYSEILNSQFYFNYKWSLSDFLNRKNGISTFMDEGSNKANYEAWKKGEDKNGYTKGHTDKPTKRFTEGAEDINYKPEEFKGPSYTEEDYKRMYESGELI